jgi:hypothetical protein
VSSCAYAINDLQTNWGREGGGGRMRGKWEKGLEGLEGRSLSAPDGGLLLSWQEGGGGLGGGDGR